jgi:NADPH-dependent curcumin reductase CurA
VSSNECVVFTERPVGLAGPGNFRLERRAVPEPGNDEVVVDVAYVSVDPAMRVWLREDPGYVPPVQIGEVMRAGGIGRVVESNSDALSVGDWVQGRFGWQSRCCAPARPLQKLDLSLGSPLDWMGPLGGTALTAYFGMKSIGGLQPDDEVLVSAAAGGVGQIAGQIALIEGARVVGIAGGEHKREFLTGTLGFDDAIDYKASSDLGHAIGAKLPRGIDLFFDNVGGATLEAALDNIRLNARIVVCGRISQTAAEQPYGITNVGQLIGKRARVQGFIVTDFSDEFDRARHWLSVQLKRGTLQQRLHVLDGLGEAPRGLEMLFRGENDGKLVVQVANLE